MPPIRVSIPGVGDVDFPDTMSQTEIAAAAAGLHLAQVGNDTLLKSRTAANVSEFEANQPVSTFGSRSREAAIGLLEPFTIPNVAKSLAGTAELLGNLAMPGTAPLAGAQIISGIKEQISPVWKLFQALGEGDYDKAAYAAGGLLSKTIPTIVPLASLPENAIRATALKLGKQIEMTALKPTKVSLDNVYSPEGTLPSDTLLDNLFKNKLGGSLTDSLKKSNTELEALTGQLKSTLRGNEGKVDLAKALDKTEAYFNTPEGAARFANDMPEIRAAIERQRQAIRVMDSAGASTSGLTDLYHGTLLKRSVGDEGAWLNGMAGADLRGRALVADRFYSDLKSGIEHAAGQSSSAVQGINRRLGEIIPIQDALVRRIPVAQRNELVGLKEFIGASRGDALGFGLGLINRSLKSPRLANFLVNISGRIKPNPAIEVPPEPDLLPRDPVTGEILPGNLAGNEALKLGTLKRNLSFVPPEAQPADVLNRDPATGEILPRSGEPKQMMNGLIEYKGQLYGELPSPPDILRRHSITGELFMPMAGPTAIGNDISFNGKLYRQIRFTDAQLAKMQELFNKRKQ